MQVYRTMHSWHWISAAICLAALLLFSITGVTLNHAASIGATPQTTTGNAQVPPDLLGELAGVRSAADAVSPGIAEWIEVQFDIDARAATIEWSEDELYLSAPGPGRDAWVSIERASGAARFEATERGWIAYFNDLHKGRHTGIAWTIFIDVAAAACVFFALTGLVLLWIQARQRTSTWPLVGGGVAILVVLMLVIAH
jgi:hypothetical protein